MSSLNKETATYNVKDEDTQITHISLKTHGSTLLINTIEETLNVVVDITYQVIQIASDTDHMQKLLRIRVQTFIHQKRYFLQINHFQERMRIL